MFMVWQLSDLLVYTLTTRDEIYLLPMMLFDGGTIHPKGERWTMFGALDKLAINKQQIIMLFTTFES